MKDVAKVIAVSVTKPSARKFVFNITQLDRICSDAQFAGHLLKLCRDSNYATATTEVLCAVAHVMSTQLKLPV